MMLLPRRRGYQFTDLNLSIMVTNLFELTCFLRFHTPPSALYQQPLNYIFFSMLLLFSEPKVHPSRMVGDTQKYVHGNRQ